MVDREMTRGGEGTRADEERGDAHCPEVAGALVDTRGRGRMPTDYRSGAAYRARLAQECPNRIQRAFSAQAA